MGHKTGVAKRIQDLQPKAYPTHCHGHTQLKCKGHHEKLEVVIRHYYGHSKRNRFPHKVFTKTRKSPGEIIENLEGPEFEAKGILGLCPTRWTVRARRLFSANPKQLCSYSLGVDNFP